MSSCRQNSISLYTYPKRMSNDAERVLQTFRPALVGCPIQDGVFTSCSPQIRQACAGVNMDSNPMDFTKQR